MVQVNAYTAFLMAASHFVSVYRPEFSEESRFFSDFDAEFAGRAAGIHYAIGFRGGRAVRFDAELEGDGLALSGCYGRDAEREALCQVNRYLEHYFIEGVSF